MSDWLHVAAVFRIDYLRGFEENEIDFDKIFGKECLFESPEYVWDDMNNNPNKYLPLCYTNFNSLQVGGK